MADIFNEEEDVVLFSIPLSGATIERLMHLSDICHADPRQVAASLLHDILKDDELYNEPAPSSTENRSLN